MRRRTYAFEPEARAAIVAFLLRRGVTYSELSGLVPCSRSTITAALGGAGLSDRMHHSIIAAVERVRDREATPA